ncbi:MAG TPA: fructose-1,6-bisphosphate aldolase/phosphatase [Candidatus Dormibacteraeota bacterium]|nr:fructose-1,6-bisphosphate aldolase/phosphatase [Candidatus Dormibacteraeota bacterium]
MAEGKKVTLSLIKADVGGWVGHSSSHPALLAKAREVLGNSTLIEDYYVTQAGDDVQMIMTHYHGIDNEEIHRLAWTALEEAATVAHEMHLYGAGQDLLVDAFSGNVKGMGPGAAELEFVERPSEPVLCFMADKTAPGAWNMPLFRMFADPMTTPGLVIDTKMHEGFIFTVHDAVEGKTIDLQTPNETYDLLMFLGAPGRFVIDHIRPASWSDEWCAVASTTKLTMIAGRYVGKDDPVCIVRCQSGYPAVGEALEPFAFPHIVPGWMRGSHMGPLMPTSVAGGHPSRFDGPPRVICLGFQIADGRLGEPRDMFDDVSFDLARSKANEVGEYLRRHGPFEPHRLPLEELEYTTMAGLQKSLESRWQDEHVHTMDKSKAKAEGPMDLD